jgi:ABC-type sugar transport system ATPase subunit
VLELILDVKSRGIPIILISHNMPHVFEVADRIHVHRLGKRLCVIDPKDYTMSDAVAFMTGAKEPPVDVQRKGSCYSASSVMSCVQAPSGSFSMIPGREAPWRCARRRPP